MRHYEIVFLSHPDQTDQAMKMANRYADQVKKAKGQVHRLEDWGRRQLAYTINNMHKAHYVLMNIECDQSMLNELKDAFRFNDAFIRHLIIKRKEAITKPSALLKKEKFEKAKVKTDEKPKQIEEKATA